MIQDAPENTHTHARNSETRVRVAVLGAGPTGIGAAWNLARKLPGSGALARDPDAVQPFLLLDEASAPGGRAASFTTPEGFTFDYGGHVLFPHAEYKDFTELLDQVVTDWHASTPIRGVWIANQLIPTPVQRNIHRLPLSTMTACLWGLWRRKPTGDNEQDQLEEPSLRTYLEGQFGRSLTHHVMGPLNHKMWAHSPETLGSAWSSHRSGSKEKNIPDVSIRGVLRNLVRNQDTPGWNETTRVRYPLEGGMGAIWDRIYDSLPQDARRLNARVVGIDTRSKRMCLADRSSVQYEELVTSIPLDVLLRLLTDRPDLQASARSFRPARVQLFGFGLRGPMPVMLKGVHAVNVPSFDVPFWRVNLPSNFSPGTVPPGEHLWSILCECSIPPSSDIIYTPAQIEAALRGLGFIPPETQVVSTFSENIPHGYPVPFAERDNLLNHVQSQLEQLDIYSRGRFGGWRYEVSNQDHAFMQGVEVIDRLHEGTPEYTYRKTW